MARTEKTEKKVRKNFRLSQRKLDEAREALGTKTETETVEAALDLVTFRREVMEGLERIGGTNSIVDVFAEEEGTSTAEGVSRSMAVRETRRAD